MPKPISIENYLILIAFFRY